MLTARRYPIESPVFAVLPLVSAAGKPASGTSPKSSPGPERDARLRLDVGVEPLELAEPVRHAEDVRVHADRHDAGDLRALLVQAIEVVLIQTLDPLHPMQIQKQARSKG